MDKYYTKYNLKMSNYTHLDSIVEKFLITDDINSILSLLKNNYQLFYVGKMSKLLFAFYYKKIFVVKYVKEEILIKDNLLFVTSGTSLLKLGNFCIQNGISGFEKIMTIPGLVGGSLINNASFLDQCISDNLLFLEIIDQNGLFHIIKKDELVVKYRQLSINYPNPFIYRAVFKINKTERVKLYNQKKEAFLYRLTNQPRILSLGSTFKNYHHLKAYKLIKDNLDFYEYDSLKLSQRHLNFIEITNETDYLKMVKLIERIQEVLYNKLGFYLESEIKIIY